MATIPTPWNLRFERDGTEDIAVIADESGDLFTSRPFWLPEEGDPTPATLAAVKLVVAAPGLLAACEGILASFLESVITTESLAEFPALKAVADAIVKATGRKIA